MAATKPNVLTILCDQMTVRVLSLYGGPVVTPNLERLAAQGVVFDNAACPYPVCSPSRAAMALGQYAHTHGIVHNVDNRDYPNVPWKHLLQPTEEGIKATDRTLGRVLHDAGWQTHHIGKWHLMDDDLPWYPDMYREPDYAAEMAATFAAVRNSGRPYMDWVGWLLPVTQTPAVRAAVDRLGDRWAGRLFTRFATTLGRLDLPVEDTFDHRVTSRCVDALAAVGEGPFMLTCSLIWPHDPYALPSPYYELYDPDTLALPANYEAADERFANDWTSEFVRGLGETGLREMLRIYYGAIRFVDDMVGRLLDALEATGRAADTIVVFTSDHGDMAGAHRMAWKNTTALYDELVRVPLIVRWPGRLTPGRTDLAYNHVDLMPTLLDCCGLPVPAGVQGRSLAPWLRGATTALPPRLNVCERLGARPDRRRRVEPGLIAHFAVREPEWKYVRYDDGEEFLYDLAADPGETQNLAPDPAAGAVRERLRGELAAWQKRTDFPGAGAGHGGVAV